MNLKTIMQERYATKKFTGEAIPQEKIDELQEMIRLAPTSYGLQAFKVKVVTDPALKEKLQAASWNQPQITTCSHLFVFCADTDVTRRLDEYKDLLSGKMPKENVENFTGMIANMIASLSEEDIHGWTARQTYIALAHALLGAKALGFDSCPMEGFDAQQYETILDLPNNLKPVVICPVGIAADEARPKTRFDDLFI